MTKAKHNVSEIRRLPFSSLPEPSGLYDPRFEHDACGVSFVVDIKGRVGHDIVATALGALCNLDHRGASGAETNTGDGAGIEFWGSSFIADPFGVVLAEASAHKEEILIGEVDLQRLEDVRRNWPFLRDRRIDAYGEITQRLLDSDC